jgi:ATP-dependent Lon protease
MQDLVSDSVVGTPVTSGLTSASLSPSPLNSELVEKHITIHYGDTGYSYETLFGDYLTGAKELVIEDPYIRRDHQLRNLIQLCELCVQVGTIKKIILITGIDHEIQQGEVEPKFKSLAESSGAGTRAARPGFRSAAQ